MTKDEILGQIDRSWAGLQAALNGVPKERLSEPNIVGQWSIKDVLGHVAFWDRYSADGAALRLAGAPDRGEADWQALNDTDAAAKAEWDVDRILTELDAAHAALLAGYRALPTLDADEIKEDWEHYDEHGAEVRTWREREGI